MVMTMVGIVTSPLAQQIRPCWMQDPSVIPSSPRVGGENPQPTPSLVDIFRPLLRAVTLQTFRQSSGGPPSAYTPLILRWLIPLAARKSWSIPSPSAPHVHRFISVLSCGTGTHLWTVPKTQRVWPCGKEFISPAPSRGLSSTASKQKQKPDNDALPKRAPGPNNGGR